MTEVKKGTELWVTTPDETGVLGKLSQTVAATGINIIAMTAYGQENKGYFRLLTTDNAKTRETLKAQGWQVDEKDVLLVEVSNKPSTLAPVAQKIANAGIDINHCYGTSADGNKVLLVFSTKDNEKAFGIISQV